MSTYRPNPVPFQGLTPREAISDTVYRILEGIDENNKELFISGFDLDDPEVTLEVMGMNKIVGGENLVSDCLDVVGPLDTEHLISGMRIHIDDDGSHAHVTAKALNQHIRPGQGLVEGSDYYLVGSRYSMDLIKKEGEDGQWKLKTWIIQPIWSLGTPRVMHP